MIHSFTKETFTEHLGMCRCQAEYRQYAWEGDMLTILRMAEGWGKDKANTVDPSSP